MTWQMKRMCSREFVMANKKKHVHSSPCGDPRMLIGNTTAMRQKADPALFSSATDNFSAGKAYSNYSRRRA